jgi:hypothetical protein
MFLCFFVFCFLFFSPLGVVDQRFLAEPLRRRRRLEVPQLQRPLRRRARRAIMLMKLMPIF